MGRLAADSDNGAAARRGQIVQRVLVDGWSAAQAAMAFGVDERDVARWVVAYRRLGMASLRDDAATGPAPLRWLRRLLLRLRRTAARPAAAAAELAPFVRSRHRNTRRLRR
jgi:transposase